ncbi:MAG: xanthine dehydrogenase family protein subunit M [Nitrososphaerota archaeon]
MAYYLKPKNLEEALRALEEPGAFPIAGGTDLMLLIRDGLLQPRILMDISELEELQGIRQNEDFIEIGAASKLREIAECQNIPYCLRKGAKLVGSPQIRNLGTIGGNICNASPSGDTLPPLIVLGAILVLESSRGKREILAESFFTGPKKTIKKNNELLTKIRIPQNGLKKNSAFAKIGGRNGMIIAQVNGALSCSREGSRLSEVSLAFGSVAPTPIRTKKAEALLENSHTSGLSEEVLAAIQDEIKPISDQRGSAEYRRALIKAIFYELLSEIGIA